jgi:hypothetical protein
VKIGDTPDLSINVIAPTAVIPSAPDDESEFISFNKMSPIQKLLITSLAISPHLYDRTPKAKVNITLAYTKYLAVLDTFASVSKMVASGTWPRKTKTPTNDDMIEIFMSKSAWFQNHSKIFPMVIRSDPIKKWLQHADDAPTDFEVWGYQKQTFDVLYSILDALPLPESPTKTKEKEKGKGKERDREGEREPAKKGDKGKKRESDNKKATTSKARHADK